MNKKRTALIVAAVILALLGGCWAYVGDYYRADEAALHALRSGGTVKVQTIKGAGTAFEPDSAEAGFIFYPGGKVEYTAYAPLMRALAEENILCVLVEMPFNLAVLDMNAADGMQEMYPQVDRWYIGGHSLGGSMAASYVAGNSEEFCGLVLLAAYSTADLTDSGLDVISIYGSEDGVLNMEKYEEYRENLPEGAAETVIDGGCHACFGSYGVQAGDGMPEITAEEQIEITREALIEFFAK